MPDGAVMALGEVEYGALAVIAGRPVLKRLQEGSTGHREMFSKVMEA
jgi:hypothetical protein